MLYFYLKLSIILPSCFLKSNIFTSYFTFFTLDGLKLKVFVPGQQKEKMLSECTDWELLNLKIDDICTLTDDVVKHIMKLNPKAEDVKVTVDKALEV